MTQQESGPELKVEAARFPDLIVPQREDLDEPDELHAASRLVKVIHRTVEETHIPAKVTEGAQSEGQEHDVWLGRVEVSKAASVCERVSVFTARGWTERAVLCARSTLGAHKDETQDEARDRKK